MITKGIVEKVVNDTTLVVRMPVFNKARNSIGATATNQLPQACVCTIPNCRPHYRIGDIVIIGFEEDDDSKPVILGALYLQEGNNGFTDLACQVLNVDISCRLPEDTSIGELSSAILNSLSGIRSNVQNQLDKLEARIFALENPSINTPET